METQIIPSKKSPINNVFASKTFEAFKSSETVQTQFKSAKKTDLENQIALAKEKFLAKGNQVKIACVGLQDHFNEKTGKFGLKKVETFKTSEQLENSTFIETSKLTDESLKKSFSAKGTRSYSYGLTKKLSFQKTMPIHEIRQEIRRNSKSTRNANGTKGFISCNSAIVTGQKLAYEKEQKLSSMLKAQSLVNHVQDETKKQENKLSKLTAKFSAVVAEHMQEKKAEQEKLSKFESKIFAIEKTDANPKGKLVKLESDFSILLKKLDAIDRDQAAESNCIIQDDGQLAFDLSA